MRSTPTLLPETVTPGKDRMFGNAAGKRCDGLLSGLSVPAKSADGSLEAMPRVGNMQPTGLWVG
jgi:hypothetical protein